MHPAPRRHLGRGLVVALLLGGGLARPALAQPAAAAAGAVEMRIATLAPDGSSWMKIFQRGAQEVATATGGRVSFKYYPGGVQGDEKEAVAKMQLGQIDGAAVTAIGLSMVDESVRVLELPMMFASVEELDYVRDKMWPTFQERFARKGYMLSGPSDVGFVYFYSNNEIKALSDLKKAKIWLWSEDKLVRALFKKLNVNGVPLGVPDVMTALNTGRIDACYASPLAAVAVQWHTKVKYATSMPMSYAISATVFKADRWAKVAKEDLDAAKKVLRIMGGKLRKAVRKDNLRAFKSIARGGVKVVETPPAMVAEFDKVARAVWEDQTGKMFSKEDLATVLKYRDEFRKQQGK